MNETAEDFMKRMTSYCMMRNMSRVGTLGYITDLRTKLIVSEKRQTVNRNNTHKKIKALDTFMEKMK